MTTSAFSGMSSLTKRQLEVLSLIAEGMSMQEIGDSLKISPSAVASIMTRVRKELIARNNAHAVARAMRRGIIE